MAETLDPEFAACLKTGKIRRFSPGPEIAPTELLAAQDDLSEARRTLAAGGYKWSSRKRDEAARDSR